VTSKAEAEAVNPSIHNTITTTDNTFMFFTPCWHPKRKKFGTRRARGAFWRRLTTHDGVTVPHRRSYGGSVAGCCKASEAARRRDRQWRARFHCLPPVHLCRGADFAHARAPVAFKVALATLCGANDGVRDQVASKKYGATRLGGAPPQDYCESRRSTFGNGMSSSQRMPSFRSSSRVVALSSYGIPCSSNPLP
jgi:hypothetical protein